MNILEIENKYKELKSLRKTALYFNISRNKLTRLFKNHNVKINLSNKSLKTKLNNKCFDIIDNCEKAYWLGFLFADGYNDEKNYKIRIELKESDLNHLIKFKNFLSSEHLIKYRDSKKSYWISIADKNLSQSLSKLGMIQNKSLNLTFPSLNKKFIFSFIRGYFDGDGSIYRVGKKGKGLNILGTFLFLKEIQLILIKNNIDCKIRSAGKIYRLEIYKIKNIDKFLELIYLDSTLFLDRKYNKMRELQRLQ